MEYVRPKRYVTYRSRKCRRYLEKDFNHECAYCKFKEILGVNKDGWEIDHFKPVSKFEKWEGVHKYENLFYSCKTCNNNKDNEWSESLLNPCKDDIYNVHIKENDLHEMIPLTSQGQEYIETLKINSTQNVIRRKKLAKLQEIKSLVEQLEKNDERIKHICDEMEDSEWIKKFKDRLAKFDIDVTYGLYEYDLDFKLKYNDMEIFCDLDFESEIEFKNHEKIKRILGEKINDWSHLNEKVCYILMDVKLDKFYYYEIQKDLEVKRRYFTLKIEEKNDIEENIEEFRKVFFGG